MYLELEVEVIAVEVRTVHDAVVIHAVVTEVEAEQLVADIETERVVGVQMIASVYLVLPIDSTFVIPEIHEALQTRAGPRLFVPTGDVGCPSVASLVRVVGAVGCEEPFGHLVRIAFLGHIEELVLHAQVVLVVHQVIVVGDGSPSHVTGVIGVHLHLAAFGSVSGTACAVAVQFLAFGGDHDNAVRSFRTVDSRSRRIFEHVDRLNVTRRDVSDAAYRKTVHDIQRFAGLREGCSATDADLHFGIGTALGGGHLHAR